MQLTFVKSRLARLMQRSIVQATFWLLIARLLRLVMQAAYFVIVARTLGSEQYGAFISVTALVAIFSPFVSWGGGDILIKHVSRHRCLFNECWGNALLLILGSGLISLVLVLLAALIILPPTVSPILVLLIALSDLIFLRILDTTAKAFIAVDMPKISAQINIIAALKSLIAALCLISWFDKPGIIIWASLYCFSTMVAALIGFLLVHLIIGAPKISLPRLKSELKDGFLFSISLSAHTIYNDIDKTMLARLSSLEATGIYAASYRLIDVTFVPIAALATAAYVKFFKQGLVGLRGTLQLAKSLSQTVCIYGITASIGLLIFAPVVPYILGDEYVNVVENLRWLSPIILLRSIQYLGADALTGAGFQQIRSIIQIGVALFNLLINFWLIPQYSWRGAAWSSLMSDTLLMVSIWLFILFICGYLNTSNKKCLDNLHK